MIVLGGGLLQCSSAPVQDTCSREGSVPSNLRFFLLCCTGCCLSFLTHSALTCFFFLLFWHWPRNLLCSSQLAALTHCTRSAAFKICSAATICLKAPFLPWCKPKTAQPRLKLMNLLKEAGHPLPLIHADPSSIYSSDHLEKERPHPKPSSLPVCSG